MNLKRNLTVTIIGSAFLLSACGSDQADASHDTPAAALEEYIEHLNEGDVETALSFVADTGGLTASNVQTFDGVVSEIPDLADGTEITDDMTSVNLDFTFGSESYQEGIFFRKDEDGWKLSEPLYLTGIHGEQVEVLEALQSAGYEFTTGEGQSVLVNDETHAYLPANAAPVQMSFDVQDTNFFEPFTWSFWLDTNGEVRNTMSEDEMTGEPNERPEELTEEMKAKIEKSAVEDFKHDQGEWLTTVLELTYDRGVDGCGALPTGGVDVALLEAGVEPLEPVKVVCHVRTERMATTATVEDGKPVAAGDVVEVIDDSSITATIDPTGDITWQY